MAPPRMDAAVDAAIGPRISPGDFLGKAKTTPLQDIRWVAANIVFPNISVREAPSSTAYGLYCWAKTDKDEFWRLFIRSVKFEEEKADDFTLQRVAGALEAVEEQFDSLEADYGTLRAPRRDSPGLAAECPVPPPSPESGGELSLLAGGFEGAVP